MAHKKTKENKSPYGVEKHWFINTDLAQELGFVPDTVLKNYIPKLL